MRSLFLQANFQQPGFVQWGMLPFYGGTVPPPPSGGFCGYWPGVGPFTPLVLGP